MDEQTTTSSESTVTRVEVVSEDGEAPVHARRELEEEFNVQRAKMKELFLQKEEDLRKLVLEKQQLDSEVLGLHAELQQLQTLSENQKSEIQSLQLLVSETVEASSSGTEEVRRLRAKNIELEQQLNHLKQQQELSLAPATFVRSIARKLGADTDVEVPNVRKFEDNELLKSIIDPLEMEITALKNKLRETDAQLQETKKVKAASTAVSASDKSGDTKSETASADSKQCDMCANYERQLVAEQARAAHHELALKLATEELEGVRATQDETVRTWHSHRASSAAQLAELSAALTEAKRILTERAAAADESAQRALHTVTQLTVDREMLQKKLDALEKDNNMLIGQYIKKVAEMQNEVINLPDDVAELQEQALHLREQLLVCATGRERALTAEEELRAQLLHHATLLLRKDDDLAGLAADLRAQGEELDRLQTEREQMKELADKLRHSNEMIESLLEDKKRLQNEVSEVRAKVSVLQQELDNGEKVQQDFVRLSQSLQVQLQRIREADTEVRWQHDEDVNECPACHTHLPNNKKKIHCRHCGRIFCSSCASHSVPAGPRAAPARVCSVCLTLLQPHRAPYFSTRPPNTPD